MSSCAASCCICFPKVSCASETSASWPIADVPPLCHFAFNCSVQHHKPSKRSPPPVPAIFGLAPSAVVRCWSSKDLRLQRSNCVLHRPGCRSGMSRPSTSRNLLRASARSLAFCLFIQPIPLPTLTGHPCAAHWRAQRLFFYLRCVLYSAAHLRSIAKHTLPSIEFA